MTRMPAVHVDPLLSYARRRDGELAVVLVVDIDGPALSEAASLRLRCGRAVDVPATVTAADHGRRRVEARVPEGEIEDGTWRLKLLDPQRNERHNLQARVLLRTGMPVALLTGRAPD